MSLPARRYNYIDSLRGLAALSVVWYHILEFNTPKNELESAARWLLFQQVDLGKVAVTLFFAISGYVIPFSLLRPTAQPLRDFAISRFFRLYPVYWLSIVLGVILLFVIPGHQISSHVILVNITMLQQFVGVQNIIGVYWTLQIELIFYVSCAAMFFLGLFKREFFIVAWIWVMLGAAIVLAILRHHTGKSLPVAIPLALSVMYFGYLWRSYTMLGNTRLRSNLLCIIAGFVLLVPVISVFAYSGLGLQYTLTYYVSLGFFIIGTTSLKINSNALAYIGKISYSLYLFGSLGMVVAGDLCVRVLGQSDITLILILTTVLAVAFSGLTYKLIEAPSIKLGHLISNNLNEHLIPSGTPIDG